MNQTQPKILIACPTFEGKGYCLQRYVDHVRALTYPNFDFLIVDNSEIDAYSEKIKSMGIDVLRTPYREKARDRIIESRNLIRQKVLDEGYDYLFSLEQDVLPPPDAIEQLLLHGKKIISGLYANPMQMPAINKTTGEKEIIKIAVPMVFVKDKEDPEKIIPLHPQLIDKVPQLLELGALGLGCVLIHRDVLEKVKFRYDPEKIAFDDMFFSKDAKEAGFILWAATRLRCSHLVNKAMWKKVKEKGY